MLVKHFTQDTTKYIQDKALHLLKQLEKEHGIVVTLGRGSFVGANATLKFTFSTVTADGAVETPEAVDFKRYAYRYGLAPADLGRSFSGQTGLFKIVGYKTSAKKFPIITEEFGTGKRFKFGGAYVKAMLSLPA